MVQFFLHYVTMVQNILLIYLTLVCGACVVSLQPNQESCFIRTAVEQVNRMQTQKRDPI